ncbi:MAG: VRR-NUC domain-containing protein [Alsobacter sp.]
MARPEQELQIAVAAFLDVALPTDWRWLHVPNGGWRTPAEASLMKAMGQKAGAADVLILPPAGRFIWIELKSPAGRLSDSQADWRDWCASIGAPWFLCRSLDDVIEALASLQIRLRARA